jgi:hypothetical protein
MSTTYSTRHIRRAAGEAQCACAGKTWQLPPLSSSPSVPLTLLLPAPGCLPLSLVLHLTPWHVKRQTQRAGKQGPCVPASSHGHVSEAFPPTESPSEPVACLTKSVTDAHH